MMLPLLVLGAVLLGALLIVPLGLPGLWLMLGAGLVYWSLFPAGGIGLGAIVIASIVVVAAEALEFTISGRYTRKYGGSRRAAWGAIGGGLIGAFLGLPVPVIGSLLGAFVGSFVGAFVAELTVSRNTRNNPGRVATGALLGRAIAAAVKSACGLLVLVILLGAAIWR